jgi:hypothetical protein
MTLIGSFPIPNHGLRIVRLDAPAVLVKPADICLRWCVTLIGSPPIPNQGLLIVLRDSQAVLVKSANIVLCGRISPVGRDPLGWSLLGLWRYMGQLNLVRSL